MTIRGLKVKAPARSAVPWIGSSPLFEDGAGEMSFEPGLNVLWGPNGSGKSSVLLLLARMLHCAQGGVQMVTHTSLGELSDREGLLDGAVIDHDGLPVAFIDTGTAVGLYGGMAAFDYDFLHEGMASVRFKGSTGQTTVFRLEKAAAYLSGREKISPVVWKERRFSGDPRHPRDLANLMSQEVLAGTVPDSGAGLPCLLMDEPDRSLDLDIQSKFWRRLPLLVATSGLQVIVATHSPFAASLPVTHYLEMKPGYLESCRAAIRSISTKGVADA